jgi:hypothetical protein
MKDGYTQAALALQHLTAADREWLLAQLPADDRILVAKMLADLYAADQVGDTGLAAVADAEAEPARLQQSAPEVGADMVTLLQATPDEIERTLDGEAEWITALLLAHADWPWGAAYLGRRSPELVARLSGMAPRLGASVKPRVVTEILRVCAQRLRQARPAPTPQGSFATMLSTLQQPAVTQAADVTP